MTLFRLLRFYGPPICQSSCDSFPCRFPRLARAHRGRIASELNSRQWLLSDVPCWVITLLSGDGRVRTTNLMSTTSVLQLTYHYSANQNLARFPDTILRTLVSKNEKVVWQPQRSIMSAPKSGLYVRYCRHLNRSNRWTPFFLGASRHRHAPSFVAGLSDGVDKSMQSHGMVEVGNPGSSVGCSPD